MFRALLKALDPGSRTTTPSFFFVFSNEIFPYNCSPFVCCPSKWSTIKQMIIKFYCLSQNIFKRETQISRLEIVRFSDAGGVVVVVAFTSIYVWSQEQSMSAGSRSCNCKIATIFITSTASRWSSRVKSCCYCNYLSVGPSTCVINNVFGAIFLTYELAT